MYAEHFRLTQNPFQSVADGEAVFEGFLHFRHLRPKMTHNFQAKKNMKKISDESTVFIVGASRSGTTLLQMSLNAHPALAICGEFHFFDQICILKREIPSLSKKEDLDFFCSRLLKAYGMQFINDAETVVDHARNSLIAIQEHERSYESFFHELLIYYKTNSDASFVGEKTPESVRYLDDLLSLYPNAKIIHIIRDPRAVVASLLRVPHNSKSILIHAATWRSDVWAGLRFAKDKQYKCVSIFYEDLVSSPEIVLTGLCEFVGIPFDKKMLSFQAGAKSIIKDEAWKAGTLKGIYDSSISKWKYELEPSDICIIELITSKILKQLGYKKIGCKYKTKAMLQLLLDAYKMIRHKVSKEKAKGENTYTTYFSNSRVGSNLVKSFFFN